MIQKWLGYLASETQDDLLLTHTSHAISDNWNFLGDWLTPKGSFRGDTPPAQQINSVHYVYQLQLASKIASVLGKAADATGVRRARGRGLEGCPSAFLQRQATSATRMAIRSSRRFRS